MLHVVLFAFVFGAIESTGVLLPMLVVGDLCAIRFFGRKANWTQVRRLLPPTLTGIGIGFALMNQLGDRDRVFQFLIGSIILSLSLVQAFRLIRPKALETVPHQFWFAALLGLLAGVTTMLANAAGPVIALYLLAVALPKWELIGTSAWLFLVLNVMKLPLSFGLDLISTSTLIVGGMLAPIIPLGILLGRFLVTRVPQFWFNVILLAFTVFAAIRLIIESNPVG